MGLLQGKEQALADAMRAANRGDANAYRTLLTALLPYLRQLVRRGLAAMGQSLADMEDIVQESLLAIHLRRHTWDEAEPLLPWVSAIARYKMIDAMRRKGRRMEISMDGFEDVFEAPAEAETVSEQELDRFMARLAEGQRRIVMAVSINGLTIRDAALRFGMSEVSVRVTLHRGLKALAKVYRSEGR